MIYFDHAATCGSRPDAVVEAVARTLREAPGNPGRSGHRLSLDASRAVEECRAALAGIYGLPKSTGVAFTKNGTEAINLALFGVLREGDRVLASSWEHNAVLRPLRALQATRSVRVELIPELPDSALDLEWLHQRLRSGGVSLVALCHASNVTGEVLPVAEAAALCRDSGAFLLVDAAQSAGIFPVDLSLLPVDALAVTGHKGLLGPPGTGALLLRDPAAVAPLIHGGTGSRSQSEEQPDFPPDKFEAGTANAPGLAGLAAGIAYLRGVGLEEIRMRHRRLFERLRARLREVPGLLLHGGDRPGDRVAIASFTIPGFDNGRMARLLERRGILCRAGLQCAPRAHRTLGTYPEGTVRFSLCLSNTLEEIDEAAHALREIAAESGG